MYHYSTNLVLENVIFIDNKLIDDETSVIFHRFSSFKCLSVAKHLANVKRLANTKLFKDINLFSVAKYANVTITGFILLPSLQNNAWKFELNMTSR